MKILEITPSGFDNGYKLKAVLIEENVGVLEVAAANTVRSLKAIMTSCGHTWDRIDDRRKEPPRV